MHEVVWEVVCFISFLVSVRQIGKVDIINQKIRHMYNEIETRSSNQVITSTKLAK